MKQQFNPLQWIHGFTQRRALETDTNRVKEIIKENTNVITKSTVEKAINIENRIASNDPLKAYKVILIDAVFKSISTGNETKQAEAEQQIRTVLSRNPKLSSYVSFLRGELKGNC